MEFSVSVLPNMQSIKGTSSASERWVWWVCLHLQYSELGLIITWRILPIYRFWFSKWTFKQMSFTYSNIKQKIIFSRLEHTRHSILMLMQIYMLPLKVSVFSDKKDQTPMQASCPGDPASQNASVVVSPKNLHPEQLQSCWDCPASKTTPVRTSDKLYTFPLHRDRTTNDTASSPGPDHYPNFLSVP